MTQKSLDTQQYNSKRIALMAGSFNPFTIGHHDILMRGLKLFDRVIVCVGLNRIKAQENPEIESGAQKRAEQIAAIYANEPRVEVIVSHSLTAEEAKRRGAQFLLRGVRGVRDFEYERDMADLNFRIGELETVILPAKPQFAAISSSAVRDIAAYGHDISDLLPTTPQDL